MIIPDVINQLGDQLDTIPELNVFRYVPDTISPPAGIVAIFDTIDYDKTYGRGSDDLVVPIIIAVGRAQDRAAATNLLPYASSPGIQSVKQVIEAGTYTAFDFVHVASAATDIVRFGGIDYWGVTFDLNITGTGA